MVSLFGPREVANTTLALAHPYLSAPAVDQQALRTALFEYLDAVQPGVPRQHQPRPRVVLDREISERLCALFELEPGGAQPETWIESLLSDGRRLFATHWPEGDAIFELTVDSIFFAGAPSETGSMTTAAAVGIIWIGPTSSWEPPDAAEACVHELAHTLLALDEHRFGHYPDYDRVLDPNHFVASAIRSTPRPISSALHSVVVACELLHFRDEARLHQRDGRLHPPSSTLLDRASHAAESCVRAADRDSELLSDRAVSILEHCRELLTARTSTIEVARA